MGCVLPALLWPLLGGCAGPQKNLSSQFPLERARAIVASSDRGDKDAVPKLVELLDDLDPAVRMYSIVALQRLTGQTYGYAYYAPPAERERAIERWREALRKGEVVVQITAREHTP